MTGLPPTPSLYTARSRPLLQRRLSLSKQAANPLITLPHPALPAATFQDRTLAELSGHVILSGSQDSFVEFARTLHSMWGQWRPTDPQARPHNQQLLPVILRATHCSA